MAHHWLMLLLGVTILQGALQSPIPVSDEEWAEFSKSLRDPKYRLPTTTKPNHYILNLTPYFEDVPDDVKEFSIDGSLDITIRATTEAVREIVMHCDDLTVSEVSVEYQVDDEVKNITAQNQNLECDTQYSFLTIPTTEALQTERDYTVKLKFTGNMQSNMRGFYRSWYYDSTRNKRWMATTQFQPGHARQAFPCYDEPGFKATFDITINREESFSPSISNMPIKDTRLVDGRVAETFHTTPKTSTYLVAFIVSHFDNIAEGKTENRPFKIYARDNANGTGDWALEVGEKLLEAMDDYTQLPFYEMEDNIDMKQAAIPDFSAGAMENWGLLTYREPLILYDDRNSNHNYKQRVANIISHEIAHMWFGNLVTCAWWDNLWLNEGFARFYQYYLTGQVEPELGYATRFIVEQLLPSMRTDSSDATHAMTETSINDPSQVSGHFSTITYAKGAAVIRMTQHLLGDSTFVDGLRRYLAARKYDVAEPHHLFEALDDAAEDSQSLSTYQGVTIDSYFRTWSEKAGHPVLNVQIDGSGQMTVTQARWHINEGVLDDDTHLWDIPITWTRAGAPDFDTLKPSQIMSTKTTTIDVGTQDREWVVFNKQAVGFYRINYDNNNWALITQALRKADNAIHEYNRAQIVDDAFAFGRAKVMEYSQVLSIISFLEFEDQYAPWLAAINGFNFIRSKLAHDATSTDNLQKLIGQFSKAITTRLGFDEKESDTFMDGLLRMNVMQFLCNNGHSECVQAGIEHFQKWKNGEFLPANLRPWVYCVGLRNGGAEEFDYFWNKYLSEELANEQVVMIEAAGCTGNQASLYKFLNAITENDEIVRPQDAGSALSSAVTSDDENARRAFEWLRSNVEKVQNRFGSVSPVLNLITPRLLTVPDMDQVQFWLDENKETIGEQSYESATSGIETAKGNIAWRNERLAELLEYFENGYVDETTTTAAPTTAPPTTDPATTASPTTAPPTTAPPTTAPPTTVPPTTADPGGAATITLSVVALLVSLSINFLN